MSQELFDYVRQLSDYDTKSLSDKALKGMEELGELAKCILPYESAFATTHRFVRREQLLEEVADTLLCLYSIGYHLDYSTEEIHDRMLEKAAKWQSLQLRSERVTSPIPYEIHITVLANKQVASTEHPRGGLPPKHLAPDPRIEEFKAECALLGVKPLLLDLHARTGILSDLQTSSRHIGNDRSAYAEVRRISDGLTEMGWVVVREKIETVPWHPMAPSEADSAPMPESCYFECHFGILVPTGAEAYFREVTTILEDLHTSRNVFKTYEDGSKKIMLTYRCYTGTREQFQMNVNHYVEGLSTIFLEPDGYSIDKPITEFSLYDTKLSHDAEWLK